MRTASPTSRTIVLRGGLLPADFNGRHSSDIPKRYTGARDITFARSARNNWIPKRDGYIRTYIASIPGLLLVSRAIRILRMRVGGARKGKGGGGKIRMVYLYRFLCVSAGMLAAPIRLQQA